MRIALSLTIFGICIILAHASKTACRISIDELTKNTSLTCYFPEDLKETEKNFDLFLYNNSYKGERVVNCLWISGMPKCYNHSGYITDGYATREVKIQIPSLTKNEIRYACHYTDSTKEEEGFCQSSVGETTCDVRSLNLTSASEVTCYFPEDISQSKKTFHVFHVDSRDKPDAVVSCFWVSENLRCDIHLGYEYNKIVTNVTAIRIPHVTKNETGKYICQIEGSSLDSLSFCELLLLPVTKTMCVVPSVKKTKTANLTCYFPEDISKSKKRFTVFHDHGNFKKDRVPVVDCYWKDEKWLCKNLSDYSKITSATSQVTVSIHNVTEEKAGIYTCSLEGSQVDDRKSCELSIALEKTCDIRPLQTTENELTCHFPEDVGESRKDFNVYHLDDHDNLEPVVRCMWYDGSLQCLPKDGYGASQTASEKFVVTIHRKPASGSYLCEISGSPPDEASLCSLTQKGKEACPTTGKIFAIILGVFLGIVIVCWIVTCCIKQKRCTCQRKKKKNRRMETEEGLQPSDEQGTETIALNELGGKVTEEGARRNRSHLHGMGTEEGAPWIRPTNRPRPEERPRHDEQNDE
ncbi:uncharacterized protein LOC112569204 [Pomacea canaliculata]|uniref:uncharacterized protein LOC112569204 n=1 Tax=Pomacea canaliculata TaxID=400727 RepID=UPI000D7277A9|nr:uncharacterized protein LOC112569204 [Pomacea canaliculata]XP_025102716.1 uncharacterized protein LOC112569204 [Pomacea canaliculata]